MLGLIFYYTSSMNFNILIVASITSIACQFGDLIFSFLKKSKNKRYKNFLPGHGGILDRLDGILVGVPVGLITFINLFDAIKNFNTWSTGSIGLSALKIVDKENLKIELLSANKNYKLIKKQIEI